MFLTMLFYREDILEYKVHQVLWGRQDLKEIAIILLLTKGDIH